MTDAGWIVLLQDDSGHVRADLRCRYCRRFLHASEHEALEHAGATRDNAGTWRFKVPGDVVRVNVYEVAGWRAIDLDRHWPTAATTADEWNPKPPFMLALEEALEGKP